MARATRRVVRICCQDPDTRVRTYGIADGGMVHAPGFEKVHGSEDRSMMALRT
jgi:hypothetical protein